MKSQQRNGIIRTTSPPGIWYWQICSPAGAILPTGVDAGWLPWNDLSFCNLSLAGKSRHSSISCSGSKALLNCNFNLLGVWIALSCATPKPCCPLNIWTRRVVFRLIAYQRYSMQSGYPDVINLPCRLYPNKVPNRWFAKGTNSWPEPEQRIIQFSTTFSSLPLSKFSIKSRKLRMSPLMGALSCSRKQKPLFFAGSFPLFLDWISRVTSPYSKEWPNWLLFPHGCVLRHLEGFSFSLQSGFDPFSLFAVFFGGLLGFLF